MSVKYAIQKGASDFSLIIGKGLMYGGGAALLVMAAVGTLAIDLVLLMYARKTHNGFLTGFILGSMFTGVAMNPVPLLIASPITSLIAVVLAVALGEPLVGAGIVAGWALAASLLGLGYGLMVLGNAMKPAPEVDAAVAAEEDMPSHSFAPV